MWNLLVTGILITFIVHSVPCAVIYKDLETDAIIIDESPTAPKLHELELALDQSEEVTDADKNEQCELVSGGTNKGKCLSLDECYSFLKHVDASDLNKTRVFAFAQNGTAACFSGKVCCGDRTVPFAKIKGIANPKAASTSGEMCDCGNATIAPDRGYGGRPAFLKEFPYATAILKDNVQFCSGSLLSSNWVLTAAHCVVDAVDINSLSVNVGEYDLSAPMDHISRGVDKIVYHSGFSMRALLHDIALLHLKEPVSFSDTVQPICLNKGNTSLDQEMYLIGWGSRTPNNEEPPSTTLQTVKLRMLSENKCKAKFESAGITPPEINQGMMCVGTGTSGRPEFIQSCMGDSGSSLSTFEDMDKAVQVGILSWGSGCGKKPGIYVKIDFYAKWIEMNMQ